MVDRLFLAECIHLSVQFRSVWHSTQYTDKLATFVRSVLGEQN